FTDRTSVGGFAPAAADGTTDDSDCHARRFQWHQSGIARHVCAATDGQRPAARFGRRRFGGDYTVGEGERKNIDARNLNQRATGSWRLFNRCLWDSHVPRWRSHLRLWPSVFGPGRFRHADERNGSRYGYRQHQQLIQAVGAGRNDGLDFSGSFAWSFWHV